MCNGCGCSGNEPHRDGCPVWAEELADMPVEDAERAEKNRQENRRRWARANEKKYRLASMDN